MDYKGESYLFMKALNTVVKYKHKKEIVMKKGNNIQA